MNESNFVGRSVPRVEGREKVTGQVEYIHHLRLENMLYGKILRSVEPHARIRSIDTSAAAAMDGVYQVVTITDVQKVIPNPYYGPAFHDQPILADGKVRFAGEPIAVVLSSDPEIAAAAVPLIEVDYEPLPTVLDETCARTSDVHVHDDLKPAETFPDLKNLKGRKGTNVALTYRLKRGDVDRGFSESDHVFEHTYRAQQVMHTPMEPFVSIAEVVDGHVTIHTSSQGPSFVRLEIARLLGWAENRVRVKTAYVGGGFGAKLYIKLEALVVALSLIAERPVKISLTMDEQFYMISRHACTIRIKSGVSGDGRILARECDVVWNGGAYADIGPRVTQKAGFTSAGPYDIENVSIQSDAIYTNRPPAGALRGFGAPQTAWAYDCHMDEIAEALGIDKLRFRLQNLLREGQSQATGTPVHDARLADALTMAADRLGWTQPLDRGGEIIRRGRGLAVGFKGITAPTTSVAIINLFADGSCNLSIGTVDMGQGSDTVMAQIAADSLGLDVSRIRVVHPDTDVTPYDMGTLGSRSTYHMGLAVREAASDALGKIERLKADLATLTDSNLSVPELLKLKFGMQAGNIIGVGSFIPSYEKPDPETGQSLKATPFWGVGAAAAEVEVDIETGKLTVVKLVNIADVGVALNPRLVEMQLSGAAIMQMGFTLTEEMLYRDGHLANGSFSDYKIPSLLDMPRTMVSEYVPVGYQQDGPFGAKGAGESSSIALSAAIGNAVADAIGVRIRELPLSPEKIWRAVRGSGGTATQRSN